MIVIVEDELLVRAGTARYLREAGFEILEATTAEECLALLAAETSIKVVFTDVRLPGQSGLDLVRIIQARHPQVKVVVTTGHQLEAPLPAGVALLRKPYFLFEIERRIGVLLGHTRLAKPAGVAGVRSSSVS